MLKYLLLLVKENLLLPEKKTRGPVRWLRPFHQGQGGFSEGEGD
jgi:hypothetical protein